MSEKPKVISTVTLDDDLWRKLTDTCDARFVDRGLPRAELLAELRDCTGAIGTTLDTVDKEFFDAAPKLRVFSTHSVGYDGIDVDEATRRGILVCNTPGVLTNAVANLTVAMILCLARRLFVYEAYAKSGDWARREPKPPLGVDVEGKTVGVVGFGRIGQEVTRRAQALGMRTIWYDVFDAAHESAPKSEYRPLESLLEESDFVTLHSNLSESTHHVVNESALNRMKGSAYLINTARGPLVDQAALTEALKSDKIAGAALDVFETEPVDENDPLVKMDNVICLPHMGTATEETRRAMRELAVENLLTALAGRRPPAPVNPEVLERE